MEEHQIRLLPVVEETGELLGLISEAHILNAWSEGPLQHVSEVMAECGLPWEEDEDDEEEGMRLPQRLEPQWRWRAHGT
jgi:CBS domain-containing protein